MAQADYIISNQTFPNTRADINSTLQAIATTNSGTSAPTTQYAGQFWIDTTSSTWTLYIHDGSDDIQFATIDTSANTVNFIDSALDVVTDTSPQLGGNLDLNSNDITGTGNINITGTGTFSGDLTVDTNTLKVDSTNNRVGIGTTSPSTNLDISSSGDATINLKASGQSNGLQLSQLTADGGSSISATNNNYLKFSTNATERMRIDSSGRLLVGTTTTTPATTTGVRLYEDGRGFFTADGTYVGYFNRLTSDGELIQLRKDGTTVGSIGVAAGDNILLEATATDHAGINLAANAIVPRQNGSGSDNGLDLGGSGNRFKDLYLGGGLYVGGTAAANKLDDYEEGTWTPTLNSGTCTVIFAKYTKIGNICYLSFRITNFSDSSSATNIEITGMPFTQPSNTEEGVGSAFGERSNVNKPIVCMNSNTIRFRNGFGVSTFDTPLQYSDINDGGDFDIMANITYDTA